jgi:hypothetical protein
MKIGESPLVNGTVLRAYVDHVRGLGLEQDVRKRLSPEALQKVDHPPLPLSWFDSRLTDQISIAVYELAGRDAVREMGRAMTSKSLARLLRPLIATSMSLFGSTPASIFSRLETFSSLMVRNAEFHWSPAGAAAGSMALRHGVPLHDAAYALWEGVFLYAFELTGVTTGAVGRAALANRGQEATVAISW